MKTQKHILLAAAALFLVVGCASNKPAQTDTSTAPASAAGAPVCNANNPGPECPATTEPAVPTGPSAWKVAKDQQLAEANAYVKQAQGKSIPVAIQIAQAKHKDAKTGKAEHVEAVKNLSLRPLATDKIAKNDKIWTEAIKEFGRQAALATAYEPQQIVVSVTRSAKAKVTQLLNDGILAGKPNQKIDLQFFTAKTNKETAILFQALDQAQFTQ